MSVFIFFLLAITSLGMSNAESLPRQNALAGNSTMENKALHAARAIPTVAEFYPEVQGDLTRVTWSHAVDTRQKLYAALRGNTMMIEADVSLGKIKFSASSNKIPIMAHPPVKTSDLSLEEFLDTILNYVRPKGIKLDIKSTSVLEETLKILKARESKIVVPLWLNADILPGPVEAKTQTIDTTMFLTLAKQYFSGVVISSGWTTRFGPDLSKRVVIKDGSYTFEHVQQMRNALRDAQIIGARAVTFPIRAGLSITAESQRNIKWLLQEVPGSTVTIWDSYTDTINVPPLLALINSIGKDRVYIDVPSGLRCRISRYQSMQNVWWLFFGRSTIGRASRASLAARLLALATYTSCATSYLPWKTASHILN